LDDIAWTLNLRGTDIDYNPLFYSYLAIEKESVLLFIDPVKVPSAIKTVLGADTVTLRPYDEFIDYIRSMATGSKVWVDPDNANLGVYQAISQEVEKIEKSIPIPLLKACKNRTEVEGFRQCHIQDGAAEIKWLHWVNTEVMNDQEKYKHHTEVTLADKLEDFRKEMKNFLGLSFPSISSFGSNAAIIHYHARPETCAAADPSKIYLIDSGAQYMDGTTDVTRTVHFGEPSAREKDAFTRVLKGVIALTKVLFPPGTIGPALDVLARQALWKNGLDFRHGTGHGVGSCLCVHEGPQGISPPMFSARSTSLRTPLKVGMVLSNEPGYYEDGNFGIRIENLMVVVESDMEFALNKDQKMLTFETLTMIPIQKSMIDTDILTEEEITWINEYHGNILQNTGHLLSKDQLEWLQEQCEPIVVGRPTPRKRGRK
jgi:Xaa-Pro aminopeptidase